MRAPLRVLPLILLLSGICFAKPKTDKPIEWITGTLLDISTERGSRVAGSDGNVDTYRNDSTFYTVDSGDKYIYVFRRGLTSHRDKELNVTINAPIKFAAEGDGFLIMDDTGKPHKVSLVKKALRKKD
ncbi:MAG: hypothetical protein WA738_06400 [Candidatus Angelobacter sp.]